MIDRSAGADTATETRRVEARLGRWFETEVRRADRDLRPERSEPRLHRIATRRVGPGRGMVAAATSLMAVVIVVAVGAALVGWLGPTRLGAVGGTSTATSPSSSIEPAATSTAPAPASKAPSLDLTARYPDGIPSTFLGEHIYRPSDLRQTVPTGPFLLGGWDAGPLTVSCPAMIRGASNPPCPSFEALAETRGGPPVIAVRWGPFSVNGSPALVLRVTAEPAPTCVSIPPGGCPGVSVMVQDVLWLGDPGRAPPSAP